MTNLETPLQDLGRIRQSSQAGSNQTLTVIRRYRDSRLRGLSFYRPDIYFLDIHIQLSSQYQARVTYNRPIELILYDTKYKRSTL